MRTIEEVYKVLADESAGISVDVMKARLADKSDPLRIAAMMLRRYWKSEKAAEKFGWIGVGRISFADARLRRMADRIAKIKKGA